MENTQVQLPPSIMEEPLAGICAAVESAYSARRTDQSYHQMALEVAAETTAEEAQAMYHFIVLVTRLKA